MKKSGIAFLHIGYWVCYFIMIMVLLGSLFGRDESTADEQIQKAFEIIFLMALLPSAVTFYTFYYFLFPRYFKVKKYILSGLYGLLISITAALMGYFLLYTLHVEKPCRSDADNAFFGIIAFMSFIALISGIIALVIQGFITWFEEIKQKELFMKKNHEMELALVKSQLDPHFLFNTINNIDSLILKDADKASNYLNNLSDIMRFMLFETKTDEISLKKEIEYIEKYIELQRIRTANELYINYSVRGELDNKSIAPMIFIPFIENAFKHTNNKKIENAIAIEIITEKEKTILKCVNKFDPTRGSNQESHGLGNVLIKKRLDLIYKERYQLEINKTKDSFSVYLSISHV